MQIRLEVWKYTVFYLMSKTAIEESWWLITHVKSKGFPCGGYEHHLGLTENGYNATLATLHVDLLHVFHSKVVENTGVIWMSQPFTYMFFSHTRADRAMQLSLCVGWACPLAIWTWVAKYDFLLKRQRKRRRGRERDILRDKERSP